MRPSVVLRSLVLVLAIAAVPARAKAPDEVAWRDWNDGLEAAATSNRPVLVDVFTDWCGWCKRMDRDVYARPDVREYLSTHFVTVKLDAESPQSARYEGRAYTLRSLATRFRVSGYPTTIFLRSSGEHLTNVPGYVPADRFLLLLHYIGDGHLDRGMEWDEYMSRYGPRTGAR